MLQNKFSYMLVVACLLILVIVCSVCPLASDSNRSEDRPHPLGVDTNQLADYEEHDPILIESDDDFETQGWPGNGTSMDPYIISNLTISSDQECIFISGTTVHFVIRDCWLSDGSCGIRFENVQNGIIEKCQISRVIIQTCSGIILRNIPNLHYLWIQDSEQINLLNSTTSFNFFLGNCSHCFVSGNHINAGWESDALIMDRCNECVVSHNNINNIVGFTSMRVRYSAKCVVSYNIFKSGHHGISISNSNECNFTGNQITDCEYSSFGLDSNSSYNIITYNYITENGQGVSIEGDYNVIYGNFLAYNDDHSYDYGNGNQWDDGFSIGNYWGNITTTEPVTIAGSAGSVDRFPIMIEATNLSMPIISNPSIIILDGDSDAIIRWVVWSNLGTYEVYRNGERIEAANWSGSGLMQINLIELPEGIYNYTLVVYDATYGQANDAVIIQVPYDSDEDGMPDYWENEHNLNASWAGDAELDADLDVLTNLEEFQYNCNPNRDDTDFDSLSDYDEVFVYGTDPTSYDTDSDQMDDAWEIQYGLDPLNATDASEDPDMDGLTNLQEYNIETNPLDSDTDNDGILDGWEQQNGFNPNNADVPLNEYFIYYSPGIVVVTIVIVAVYIFKNRLEHYYEKQQILKEVEKKKIEQEAVEDLKSGTMAHMEEEQ